MKICSFMGELNFSDHYIVETCYCLLNQLSWRFLIQDLLFCPVLLVFLDFHSPYSVIFVCAFNVSHDKLSVNNYYFSDGIL